ncbi:hypothetical protein N7528_004841 [Penicillium herquei]|nr:hypothetical protein N7528_004841 [Penicillium herquei]
MERKQKLRLTWIVDVVTSEAASQNASLRDIITEERRAQREGKTQKKIKTALEGEEMKKGKK